MCALGDTKLVCFGGMSPATQVGSAAGKDPNSDADVMVMSDIHIFDVVTSTWTYIPTPSPPEGRYAHCATILPSSAVFTASSSASATVIGGLGHDGFGGAQMVVVGGQDSANHYIEEINVFNLRSLQWTSKSSLDRSCGAYRSVVAPLGRSITPAQIGKGPQTQANTTDDDNSAMLIYSNYNFLDVKLELQIRHSNGTLSERPMNGHSSPPGLRFPNGGVLANHFVVSGTYLTSSKQEYALWALNLTTLEWSRIDAGSVFSTGSWNRGVLWPKRNSFLILGNKSRSLVEDYNHRRINFTNLCLVELEAFGLFENHRPTPSPGAQDLGRQVLAMKELADMEFLAVGGERIPVVSRIVAKRWGSYFLELLQATHPTPPPPPTHPSSSRAVSMATITPGALTPAPVLLPPTTAQFNPLDRPRTLFLPHTHQTLLTFLHFLYTGVLPPAIHPQSSAQILCSLLQLARPYRVEGLLEAVVERLHQVLDSKNAAAVFNAAAMAAGGGQGVFVAAGVEEDASATAEGWGGGVSQVIGLQKRGLRGLMEGRRMRERSRSLGGNQGGMGPGGGSVTGSIGQSGNFGSIG